MHKYSQVSLPDKTDQTLLLICEELKSRRLQYALQMAGIEECYFLPHLDSIILKNLGLDEDSNNVFRIYNRIMENRSRKIKADHDSIVQQALKAYNKLVIEKKNWKTRKAILNPLRLPLLLMRRRKQHIVKYEPVPG